MAVDQPGFLAELQCRHVWRAAIACALASWLLTQVAPQLFTFFDIPNWTVRLVVAPLAPGLPIVAPSPFPELPR